MAALVAEVAAQGAGLADTVAMAAMAAVVEVVEVPVAVEAAAGVVEVEVVAGAVTEEATGISRATSSETSALTGTSTVVGQAAIDLFCAKVRENLNRPRSET